MTIGLPKPATKVLSIQSHVVHGYVGNKAACFPLQMLNWDVDILNSVNFSNHTGYGKISGNYSTGEELRKIYEGLKKINMKYDAVLTGYTHGALAVESIAEICCNFKESNPDALWLLDPVMGDEGEMYVSEEVIPHYQRIVKSGHVDIITPNQFELELLLGFNIIDRASLKKALKILHNEYKIKHVVISSMNLGPEQLGISIENSKNVFFCCASSYDWKSPVVFEIDKFDSYFTGVGDLFSALLLDRLYKSQDLLISTNQVLSVMSKVLFVTQSLCFRRLGKLVEGKIGDFETMKECELRIVECRDLYDRNECNYEAIEIVYTDDNLELT
ncbi:hypothetical protein CANARDRAFT_6789 [[Candida] arabinofermentans NRRL YB-2248]|uniref:pyridoxal kinase n=1 Tax=[Candida] arabinofermentans NRRL YB-2248 TaxID=983967 RepID=A0A1E4T3F6_9ASCO|nr:hypothetical protein CANARDRAFT_6789 [[Candida] arabinofermentans NRRL YB-2248]